MAKYYPQRAVTILRTYKASEGAGDVKYVGKKRDGGTVFGGGWEGFESKSTFH